MVIEGEWRAASNEDEQAVSDLFPPVDLGDVALPTLVSAARDENICGRHL